MAKDKDKLTPKQKAFCDYYLINGFNGTQAAISAGYSKKTADRIAEQNLRKLELSEYINERRKKVADKCEVTFEELTLEYKKIAFSSIANLHNTWIELKDFEALTDDQKACIESIDTKTESKLFDDQIIEVKYVKIKLYDKLKALQELGKHIGYYEKDNEQKKQIIQITGMRIE